MTIKHIIFDDKRPLRMRKDCSSRDASCREMSTKVVAVNETIVAKDLKMKWKSPNTNEDCVACVAFQIIHSSNNSQKYVNKYEFIV